MSLIDDLHAFFPSPWPLLLMACVVFVGWTLRQKHLYLLWMAASLVIGAFAKLLQLPYEAWPAQSPSAWLYWAGACCMAQAMAMRFGKTARFYMVAAIALCVLLGAGFFRAVYTNPLLWDWVATGALVAILAHVVPGIWGSAKRHTAEHFLQWSYFALVALVAASPLYLYAEWSFFSTTSYVWLPIMTAVAGAVLASAYCDGAAAVRTDGHSDPVTGLLNRYGFEAYCSDLPSSKGITVVVLCEIDHFPQWQQQAGVHAAQAVLCHFAHLLRASVREGDAVARIGEQEFALALRQMQLQEAHMLVQRMNTALRKQHWANKAKYGQVTASFSIAKVQVPDSLNLALHRADVLLCQAKDDGASGVFVEASNSAAPVRFAPSKPIQEHGT